MATPRTAKSPDGYLAMIYNLNASFNLELPNHLISTPTRRPIEQRPLGEKCVALLKPLYYNKSVDLDRVLKDFSDWAKPVLSDWVPKAKQEPGTLPSPRLSFIHDNTLAAARSILPEQRMLLLEYLWQLLRDEEYILNRGESRIPHAWKPNAAASNTGRPDKVSSYAVNSSDAFSNARNSTNTLRSANSNLFSPEKAGVDRRNSDSAYNTAPTNAAHIPGRKTSPQKRKDVDDFEVFVTAPSSPSASSCYTMSLLDDDDFADSDLEELDIALDMLNLADPLDGDDQVLGKSPKKQTRIDSHFPSSKSTHESSEPSFIGKASPDSNEVENKPDVNPSFSTVNTSRTTVSFGASTAPTSFSHSFANDHFDEISQCSSTAEVLQSDEATRLFNDTSFVAEKPNSQEVRIQHIIKELEEHGPFSTKNIIQTGLPLRYRYEAQRVANYRRIHVEDLLRGVDHLNLPDYDDFWKDTIRGLPLALEKTRMTAWNMAVSQYEDQEPTGDVVTLSGQLSWCDRSEKGYFKLTLNPLKFERSYRFCRRFGSDRFLEITFPTLTRPPGHLVRGSREKEVLLTAVTRWLATSEHHILGRIWRGFYLEDVQPKKAPKTKKDDKDDCETKLEMKNKVFLFAIDGIDFATGFGQDLPPQNQTSEKRTKMSIDTLTNWHMPIADNINQTDCKLFQRFSLGLSRTRATVVLRREETVFVEDPPSPAVVMNDGCALMSRSLGMEIARILDLEGLPACYQARIAGAKGVWMVDRDDSRFKPGERNFGIQITESQLKIRPAPQHDRRPVDDARLTFEVVSYSRPLKSSSLSVQVLKVLQHGGVQEAHIERFIRQSMSTFYGTFLDVVSRRTRVSCRGWLQMMRPIGDEGYKRKTRRLDDIFPTQYIEQAALLVENGFSPMELPYLTELFKGILKSYLDDLFDNVRITVMQSTFAYCIADPLGVLEPGEIHLGFSRVWEDGVTGTELHETDVLVTRLPAHLASDIQKRKAVYKSELRHFKDVVIFPTTGDYPLAGMLSGGDYDGDQCWVCWDQDIVTPFTNTPFNSDDQPPPEDLGLISHATKMNKVESVDAFLAKTFMFNAHSSKLGTCTIEHETFCYHQNGISSEGAVMISWLLSYLVDSKKAGLELTEAAWHRLRGKYIPRQLQKPAYKEENPQIWNRRNILDFLKFGVIQSERDELLEKFDIFRRENGIRHRDSHLVELWETAMEQARSERRTGNSVLFDALEDLKNRIVNTRNDWNRTKYDSYATSIAMASQKLEEIQPPHFDHDLSCVWRYCPEEWANLRASCLYAHSHVDAGFVWFAAGMVLARMKVKARGPFRTMECDTYRTMRVSQNAVKRFEAKVSRGDPGEEDDDDEFLDVDESIFWELEENYDGESTDEDWISAA
ncbi:hypothetical protein FQN51_007905 [Onygenales sp. PD_10]|nr:hypothetical protein FQN51_007905 [Onygenales sp. PD_10]